jgi:hypothetical protein
MKWNALRAAAVAACLLACSRERREVRADLADASAPRPRPVPHVPRKGIVVGQVEFTVVVDADPQPGSSISLERPKDDLDGLIDADEVVVPVRRVTLVLNYPLSRAFEFPLVSERNDGFTRQDLVEQIASTYQRIYRQEDRTANEALWYTYLENFANSDGLYGIHSHVLGDLVLVSVRIERDGAGDWFLFPDVDS